MTLIIISGEIDVSVGPMWLLSRCAWHFCCNLKFRWRCVSAGVAVRRADGNAGRGAARVFNVPSFVATLGLWSALRGWGCL